MVMPDRKYKYTVVMSGCYYGVSSPDPGRRTGVGGKVRQCCRPFSGIVEIGQVEKRDRLYQVTWFVEAGDKPVWLDHPQPIMKIQNTARENHILPFFSCKKGLPVSVYADIQCPCKRQPNFSKPFPKRSACGSWPCSLRANSASVT